MLAFATCFTEFKDKRELLLELAGDADEFVRGCAIQSLWYRADRYSKDELRAIQKILDAARAKGGELVEKFTKDILQKNPSLK